MGFHKIQAETTMIIDVSGNDLAAIDAIMYYSFNQEAM